MKLSNIFFISAGHLLTQTIIIFLCVFICDVYFDTLVITKQGWIRGSRASDGNYIKYLGIPYAKVDDDNPFGESIPFPKFKGVFKANNNSIMCPQVELLSLTYGGTLNCLCLNIFVPISNKPKLPIMIYIHGGRFALGFTGSFRNTYFYGPKYIVRHGVIFITVNYRLGPYGFFCLDSAEVPGNQGIKDIVKALSWIHDNIAAFGGDVKNITIFGHSAGAMIIDLLLYTKAEKYITQAILQSGTAHANDVLGPMNNTVPIIIANYLGSTTKNLNESLFFLKNQNVRDVIIASKNLSLEFRPCIEKQTENNEGLIFKDPFNSEPNVKGKKIILGHATEEYNIKLHKKPIQYFKDNDIFDNLLQYEFDFNNEEGKHAISLVQNMYIGNNEVNENVKWKIVNFTSDITFNYPAHRDMEKFLRNGAHEVYYYIFSYESSANLYKKLLNISVGRTIHGDELSYLFKTSAITNLSDKDRIILDRMTTMWTNFAKFGNPTPNTTELLPVKWIPISKRNKNYLLIDIQEGMGENLFRDRIQFWDTFYNVYRKFLRKDKKLISLLL